jgi:hypothetical protein
MSAINANTLRAVGTLLEGVGNLLAAQGGGAQPAPAGQAAPAAQAAKPVDQFQGAPAGAPAQAAAAPQPAPGGRDLAGTINQLVQTLTSLVTLLQQFLGKGQGAGGAAPGGAPAGGAQAGAAAGGAQAFASATAGAAAGASAGASAGGKAPISSDPLTALSSAFGAWHGKGKNSAAPTGPNAKKLVAEAYAKLQSGDSAGAAAAYKKAQQTSSPVMLDLNHDGKLGTTGVSTAKDRVDGQVGKTVSFDIDGDGRKDQVEWMDGKGDGMLVDDSDGGATAAANGNGEINGTRLFGDQGGQFSNGYEKLQKHDANGDGKLTGGELNGLKVWVDNGDAKVGQGELKSLAELGVTEISTGVQNATNGRGENLMQSSFVQNGQQRLSEDVWFAKQ